MACSVRCLPCEHEDMSSYIPNQRNVCFHAFFIKLGSFKYVVKEKENWERKHYLPPRIKLKQKKEKNLNWIKYSQRREQSCDFQPFNTKQETIFSPSLLRIFMKYLNVHVSPPKACPGGLGSFCKHFAMSCTHDSKHFLWQDMNLYYSGEGIFCEFYYCYSTHRN